MITIRIYRPIKKVIIEYRRLFVTLGYIFQTVLANYLALILRFEGIPTPEYFSLFLSYLPILLLIRIFFYLQAGLYKDLWRYASINDLFKIVKSTTEGSIVFFVVVRFLFGDIRSPRSIYVLEWLLLIMIAGGGRLFIRIYREYLQTNRSGKRILIYGAGDAGEMIVRDMKNNPKCAYEVIGFIDDDPYKKGLSIHGFPIFGARSVIDAVIEKYRPEEILISMPAAGSTMIKEIYDVCKPFKIPIKTLPGLNDIPPPLKIVYW